MAKKLTVTGFATLNGEWVRRVDLPIKTRIRLANLWNVSAIKAAGCVPIKDPVSENKRED